MSCLVLSCLVLSYFIPSYRPLHRVRMDGSMDGWLHGDDDDSCGLDKWVGRYVVGWKRRKKKRMRRRRSSNMLV